MATKKEKREASRLKREAMLAEIAEEGLEAQRLDQTIRDKQREKDLRTIREINEKYAAIIALRLSK